MVSRKIRVTILNEPFSYPFQPFLRFWIVKLLLEHGADPNVFQPFLRF